MTTAARDGRDKPFCDWLRRHPQIDSNAQAIYAADVDMSFLKFKTPIDWKWDRTVKLAMDVEIKTWGAKPSAEQVELLYYRHQLLNRRRPMYSTFLRRRVSVWYFGQFLLRIMGGERPDVCETLLWGMFTGEMGAMRETMINESTLAGILSFRLDPSTLNPLNLRRHHKTTQITVVDTTGLLPVERLVTRRS